MTKRGRGSLATRREVLVGGTAALAASTIGAPAILAATTAPLKLGVLNTFSGPSASTGDWNWNGMGVYLDSVNNTIAGRKVDIIKEDDQFNPQVGLEKMRKFVESDKVDMVVGIQGSNIALAMLNYIKQSKAFLLVSGAGTDALTWERVPNLFRSSISGWQRSAIRWPNGFTTLFRMISWSSARISPAAATRRPRSRRPISPRAASLPRKSTSPSR